MKKILFKQILIRNFLSIGTTSVKFDFTQGVNLITGINLDKEDASNGSGKSSVVNAIYFCLYGKCLKDLKIDQIPNTYTKGACEVTLDLQVQRDSLIDNYTVTRSLRPTKLKLVKNGEDITKSTVIQTSELLQNIINCSNTVFENSVVMDANNATSFMSQKKVEKRKFLEGILNLGVFGEMLNIARTEFNNTKYNFDVEDSKLKDCTQLLNTYKVHKEQCDLANQNKKQTITDKITNISLEVKNLKDGLKQEPTIDKAEEIKEKISKLNELKKTYTDQNKDILKKEIALEHTRKDLEYKLNKLSTLVDICNTCDRPYTEVDKQSINAKSEQIKQDLRELQYSLEENKNQGEQIDTQQKKVEASLQLLARKQQELKNNSEYNKNINWKINQLEQDISQLNQELSVEYKNEYDEHVIVQCNKLQEIQKQVADLTVQLETLQAAKFILSEEGVRSYIVKKILRVLNSKLNGYLKKLDANTKCEFNEYFEETLWDQYGNERSYHNFSSGEQRRIDLAILFAFQDIRKLQADVSMNISIYDELLDSSLDRKGAELVLFLLKERAEKNKDCVYIISHRKEAQSTHTSRVITLQKKNGITTLIE